MNFKLQFCSSLLFVFLVAIAGNKIMAQTINNGDNIISNDTLFYDPFDNMNNWTIAGPDGYNNWHIFDSDIANGDAIPEVGFQWDPVFIGDSYLLSQIIPGTAGHNIRIIFNYYFDYWSNYPTLRVAYTTDDGANYTNIWEKSFSGNYGPAVDTILMTGENNLRLALYYGGDSNDLDFWYVDDFTVEDLGIVPVELTSFNATANINNVILNWSTATETNNKGFEIQRKNNSEFEKVGFINGKGTTSKTNSYTYTDNNLSNGKYIYRLKQIDFDGSFNYSKEVEVNVLNPVKYSLEQNFPNPFNPTTNITYQVAEAGNVSIKVYDLVGNEVAVLLNDFKNPGNYSLTFNASNMASGVYFYTMKTNNFLMTKKLILLK